MIKKLNYNQRLRMTCINMAGLARRMKISAPLFEWRYNVDKVNFAHTKALCLELNKLIYELVQIRDDIEKDGFELAKEAQKKLEGFVK